MKFLIPFYEPVLDLVLFAQSVVHLLARDTQFPCSAFNRHYSEMNPAVNVVVCIRVLIYSVDYVV